MSQRHRMLAALAAFAVAVFGFAAAMLPASAQDYPSKPVTVIIPLAAGGSHDITARVFTSVIPEFLGQPVVVRMTPGAGGQTGTAEAIDAPADGYTLLFTHNFIDQLQPLVEDLPYDTNADLQMVARLNSAPAIFWVRADSPWQNLDDIIEYARENPAQLRYAHSGKWGTSFTGGAVIFSHYGVDVTFLPYKGGGPTKQAVLAGDADFTVGRPSTILSEIEAGTVRPILIGGAERIEAIPDVPTTEELGLATASITMHRIVQAPAGVPEERLAVLRKAFAEMQENKTYQRLMSQLGEDTDYLDGPEYEALRADQAEKYLALVKSLAGS